MNSTVDYFILIRQLLFY